MYLERIYGKYQKNSLEICFNNLPSLYSVRELAGQTNIDPKCKPFTISGTYLRRDPKVELEQTVESQESLQELAKQLTQLRDQELANQRRLLSCFTNHLSLKQLKRQVFTSTKEPVHGKTETKITKISKNFKKIDRFVKLFTLNADKKPMYYKCLIFCNRLDTNSKGSS